MKRLLCFLGIHPASEIQGVGIEREGKHLYLVGLYTCPLCRRRYKL